MRSWFGTMSRRPPPSVSSEGQERHSVRWHAQTFQLPDAASAGERIKRPIGSDQWNQASGQDSVSLARTVWRLVCQADCAFLWRDSVLALSCCFGSIFLKSRCKAPRARI